MSRPLKPFGKKETTWHEPSLSEIIGHLETLISNEEARTESCKHGGPLDVRMEIAHEAYTLLQVVDNGDIKIMNQTVRAWKRNEQRSNNIN